MRALPALSLAYFGSTADGNTALPAGIEGAGAASGFFATSFGAGAGAGAAAGVAVASAPHSALRKSFHFWPLSVPADVASLYFALHSDMLNACAGMAANAAKPDTATAHNNFARMVILGLPGAWRTKNPYPSVATACDNGDPSRRCNI